MGIFITVLVIAVTLIIVLIGVFTYKNRRLTPDYFEYYKTRETVPSGKIGIFAPSLIMPEQHAHTFLQHHHENI